MAELSTLARPYAKAAFEFARSRGELTNWSAQLATVATVIQDPSVGAVLDDPAKTSQQLASTIGELCGDAVNDEGRNFVAILAENKRLALLPEIRSLFEQYKANQEKTVQVQVHSAFALADETQQKLADVLTRKLEREVKVDTAVDEALLGGVLIRAGDLVIDGSVRGRLNKLAEAMNS
jgi:F-type H+-transporting ATPase subunit delta